jgi:hypothetical protein
MDSELFVEFLKHLNEFVINRNIPKPIMLLVDGHSTHMSFDAAHYCFSNGIILYCLLANATHVLQPCDVGFFSPMKAAWKKEVKTWQLQNLGQALTKKHFPGVFKKAWLKVAKIENAIHGFQKCGLFPLNPNNIDLTKLNPSKAISHIITSESGEQIGDDKDVAVKVTGDAEVDSVQLNNTSEMSTSSNMITSLDVTTDDMNACISTDYMNTSSQISTDADDKLPKNFIDSCEKINHVQGIHQPTANITDITDISSGNQAPGPSYVKQSREMVSESFSLLAVPEVKKKRSANTLRKRLPKALSGKEALRMLQEKENAKKADELAKQKRKEEREAKKAKKLEEKELKRIQREENKKKREQSRLVKHNQSHNKKRSKTNESESSESSKDDFENPLIMDSDDDCNEELICPGCQSDEGSSEEWIRCTACSRRWHITCTGDAVLFEIPTSQINNYPFHCEFCV